MPVWPSIGTIWPGSTLEVALRVGLDIGYSNLKLVYGDTEPTQLVRPVGAGPRNRMPVSGEGDTNDLTVTIDGEDWAACVEPSKLQEWPRELHADYPSSTSYRALFYAATILCGSPTIDCLVTGLPVSQWNDAARRTRLQRQLTGEHQVTRRRSVSVKKVVVLAQPLGAYLDYLHSCDHPDMLREARVVVVDPGFFSVDFVAIEDGSVLQSTSGSSTQAVSRVLERLGSFVQSEYGANPGLEKLEWALRSGRDRILVHGEQVQLSEFNGQAQRDVAPIALREIRTAMRVDDRPVDLVLIAGGGAKYYRDAVSEAFPKARVAASDEPVLENARGFWHATARR